MTPSAPSARLDPAWSRRGLDALLWAAGALLVLLSLRTAYITLDGLGRAYGAVGPLTLNANHLVFEPANKAWLALTERWFSSTLPVDRLRWLSALCGAVAVALFRFAVGPRVASRRREAQLATAGFAFSAGFLQLWLSAECHMVQLPACVLAAAALLRWQERPSPARAAMVGLAIAAAGLCFVSLLGLAPAAALLVLLGPLDEALPRGRRAAAALVVLAVAAAAATSALALAWRTVAAAPPFLHWVLGYNGMTPRLALVYGIQPWHGSLAAGSLLAAARAVYGAAAAWLDITVGLAAWRDRGAHLLPILQWLLAAVSLAALGRGFVGGDARPDRAARALTWLFVPPLLLFGWRWNNSDAQFYVPLAIAFGALAARSTGRAARGAVLAVLALNLVDAGWRYALYPRDRNERLLTAEVAGACAVVEPGFDDALVLLALRRVDAYPLHDITKLAVNGPAADELPRLRRVVEACLARGGRVDFVNLYDRPPQEPPWKFLGALGYPQGAVLQALDGLPLGPIRTVGPFTIRSAAGAEAVPIGRP